MTSIDLTVELDTDTVAVGNEVRGRVRAGSSAAGTDAPVLVQLLWHTSGRCDSEEKVVAAQHVSPTAPGGGRFRLHVPEAGPMTYAGRTFSIHWCVRIADGPTAQAALTVVAAVQKPSEAP